MYCTVRHKVAISHHLRTLDMEENETMSVGHPMLCKTNKNFIKKRLVLQIVLTDLFISFRIPVSDSLRKCTKINTVKTSGSVVTALP